MKFVVCINNEGYKASLEKGKIYQVLEEKASVKAGLIRIIDESEEDYLYSEDMFVSIKVPKEVEKALIKSA